MCTVPGPPENLNVIGSTTFESITVQWEPPASPNGVISHYFLTWSPDDPSDPIIINNTTYTLTDLLPCTIYNITVSAATSKGSGEATSITGATQSAGMSCLILLGTSILSSLCFIQRICGNAKLVINL